MSRRAKILLILLVVCIALFVIFLLGQGSSSKTTVRSTSVLGLPAENTGISSSPINDKAVIYSNGRSFVSQDLTNNKTSVLASFNSLPDISRILPSPDENYLIVRSENHIDNDDLTQKIQNAKLPTNASYWWFIDKQTSTARLLPQTYTNFAWAPDSKNFYAVVTSNNTSHAQVFTVDTLTHSTPLETSRLTAIRPIQDGFITQKADYLVRLDKNYANPAILVGKISGDTYFNVSSTAYAALTKPRNKYILVIHFANNKEVTIDQVNKISGAAWNEAGDIFAYTASNGKTYVVDASGQHEIALPNTVKANGVVAVVGDKDIIVQDGQSLKLLGVGSSFSENPGISNARKLFSNPKFNSSAPYVPYYEPQSNTLSITITGKPVANVLANAMNDLKNQGINPDSLYIKVYISQAALRG